MKKAFAVSLCREGVLGGGLYVAADKLIYRTGKLSVSPQLRRIELPFADIAGISKKWALCFPAVIFTIKGGEEYKFLVFARGALLKVLKSMGFSVDA